MSEHNLDDIIAINESLIQSSLEQAMLRPAKEINAAGVPASSESQPKPLDLSL